MPRRTAFCQITCEKCGLTQIVITDTNNGSNPILLGVTVAQVPSAPLSVNPPAGTLPSGQMNQVYSQTLTASGGSGNYSWAITNQSAGLNLSLSPTTGTSVSLTGTPTAASTSPGFSITVTLTDTTTGIQLPQAYTIPVASLTQQLTLTVSPNSISTTTGG